MGAEIGVIVRYKGDENKPKEIYSDYVIGKDSGMMFLERYVQEHAKNPELDSSLILHYGDEALEEIKKGLQEYTIEDEKSLQKVRDTIVDLREARRHATTLKDFDDFSSAIDEETDWIKNDYYPRSDKLINYITTSARRIHQHCLMLWQNKNITFAITDSAFIKDLKDNYEIEIYVSE